MLRPGWILFMAYTSERYYIMVWRLWAQCRKNVSSIESIFHFLPLEGKTSKNVSNNFEKI